MTTTAWPYSAMMAIEIAPDLPSIAMREVTDKSYQARLLHYQSLRSPGPRLARDLAQLQNNRDVELYPYQTNSWWYIGFNLKRSSFR